MLHKGTRLQADEVIADLEDAVDPGAKEQAREVVATHPPYLLRQARFGFRMGDGKALDAMVTDGLTNAFTGKHMAQEASEVAASKRPNVQA